MVFTAQLACKSKIFEGGVKSPPDRESLFQRIKEASI